MRPMRLLIVVLEVLLVMVASSALIRWVMMAYNGQEMEISQVFALRSKNQAKFDDLVEQGTLAARSGTYDAALERYEEAQRVVGRMSDSQYTTLQTKRQEIASAGEKSGNSAQTLASFAAMANAAVLQGDGSLKAHLDDDAVAKFAEAEGYAPNLAETKNAVLIASRRGQANAYRDKKDYSSAADASLRMIDTLEATSDAYDPQITAAYLDLAKTYSQAQDWHNAEETLMIAWRDCDKRIAHYSSATGEEQKLAAALHDKDVTLTQLMGVYEKAQDPEHALAIAEENYKFMVQNAKGNAQLGPTRRVLLARSAMAIAQDANRTADVALWRGRLMRPY